MTRPKAVHEDVTQDTHTGKWMIVGHRELRGLLFAKRRHAVGFLRRVKITEDNLERAMRLAVESIK